MTDPRDIAIEALAEALALKAYALQWRLNTSDDYQAAATILLASPRLASLLLTGAAVEMLGDDYSIHVVPPDDERRVIVIRYADGGTDFGRGHDLLEAIDALGNEPEAIEKALR